MFKRMLRKLSLAACLLAVACREKADSSAEGRDAATLDGSKQPTDTERDGSVTARDASISRDSAAEAGLAADPTKLMPGCFVSEGITPQLSKGSLFEGADWNDPSVLKVGEQYVMYASADRDFGGVISIYRLVSPDGKVWSLEPKEPVLAPNDALGAWDHKSVETPSVVLFQGSYHMFYTGYPVAFTDTSSYRIGHAISADGISWTRDTKPPLVAPTCPGFTPSNQICPAGGAPTDFHAFLVAEPGAVVFAGKLHLYFSANGYDADLANPLLTIGVITSSDGITWTAPQKVMTPDQAQYPRSKWLGYSTPAAVDLGGQLHLFFDVARDAPFAQLALHHAYSADGKTGFVQDESELFSTSTFSWASREIRAPAALLDDTTLRLWFAGDDGNALAIAGADCAL